MNRSTLEPTVIPHAVISFLVLGVNLLSREGNSQTGEWMLAEQKTQEQICNFLYFPRM